MRFDEDAGISIVRCHGLRSGAQGARHHLGISPVVVGVVAKTPACSSIVLNVVPEIVMPKEHIVTTAVVASLSYSMLALYAKGWGFDRATLIAALSAFLFRIFAVRDHWPQIVPYAPPVANQSASEKPLLKKVGGSRQ